MRKNIGRTGLAIALIISMAGSMIACGSTADTTATTDTIIKETQEATAETSTEEVAEETTDEAPASEATSLPAYEYPGPELFYSVLYQYLIDELGQYYEAADVTIPCPIIIHEDESDKEDIRVWGNFYIYNYELNGDTLETTSGGSHPGCIHLKSTDEGYKVTSFETVADGSDFEPTAKKIFGDYYEDLTKSSGDEEANEALRAQIIANYVAANNLEIKAYKDYGWDPVELPEENIDSFYSVLD